MANIRRANIQSVDSTGTLTENRSDKVVKIVLTNTAANGAAVLSDTSDNNILTLKHPTDGSSVVFDFSDTPIALSAGLKAKTLTNCVLSIIYTQTGGAIS